MVMDRCSIREWIREQMKKKFDSDSSLYLNWIPIFMYYMLSSCSTQQMKTLTITNGIEPMCQECKMPFWN